MKHSHPPTLLLAITALALSGCGGGLVAPEGPQSDAFLNQVSSSCGKLDIGGEPIGYLLDANSDDTYLVDEVSKLLAGEIDEATFASDINSFYPAGDNRRAIDCILAQLDGG